MIFEMKTLHASVSDITNAHDSVNDNISLGVQETSLQKIFLQWSHIGSEHWKVKSHGAEMGGGEGETDSRQFHHRATIDLQ